MLAKKKRLMQKETVETKKIKLDPAVLKKQEEEQVAVLAKEKENDDILYYYLGRIQEVKLALTGLDGVQEVDVTVSDTNFKRVLASLKPSLQLQLEQGKLKVDKSQIPASFGVQMTKNKAVIGSGEENSVAIASNILTNVANTERMNKRVIVRRERKLKPLSSIAKSKLSASDVAVVPSVPTTVESSDVKGKEEKK